MTGSALRSVLSEVCDVLQFEPPESWSAYLELAHRWGQRMNLTAARDATTLCELLFVDAVALLRLESVSAEGHWVDIGAGVGAPTLPVMLARPKLRATLVEPRRKRVAFLRSAVGTLGLAERVDVREERIDPTTPSAGDRRYTVALSRATFEPSEWLGIGSQLADRVLVFGTRDLATEAQPTATVSYVVPSTGAPRTLSVLEKQP